MFSKKNSEENAEETREELRRDENPRLFKQVSHEKSLPRWCACRSWWGRRWVSWGAPSLDRETCGVSWPAWRECPRGSPAEPHRQPRHPRHQPHCIPRRAWAPRPPGARKGVHRRSPFSRSLKAPGDKRINAWPKSTHFDTPRMHAFGPSKGYIRKGEKL